MRAFAVLLALLAPGLAGCLLPGWGEEEQAPEVVPTRVDPPPRGTGFAACASRQALQLAVGFVSEEVFDDGGAGPGLHRLDNRSFLWVWASYDHGTLREDDVRRVNEVQVFQEHDGRVVVCTRVELVTPLQVDPDARRYDVAVRLAAARDLPPGPVRVVVNWVAGCAECGVPSQGNTTAEFPATAQR